jgi:hypothetical protein
MLADERLKLRDQLVLAPEREICLDPRLQRRQPRLLETSDLLLRELLVPELGERRPTPERESLAQHRRRAIRVSGVEVSSTLACQLLEAPDVGLVPIERQRVAATSVTTRSAPSAFRSCATYTRTAFVAVAGGSPPHSSSARLSTVAGSPRRSSSSTSSARCFGASTAIARSPSTTRSGPRSEKSTGIALRRVLHVYRRADVP